MKLVTSDLIDGLIAQAGTNARKRTHHNVHETPSDPVQRLFVAARRDSYFRPHRHPKRWEFALVTRGLFDVIVFDDTSRVIERVSVGPGANTIGIEIPPNTWHTWLPGADGSVFFETTPGPYDAKTAKEFATWTPAEGTSPVREFLGRLRSAKVGDLVA